MDEKEIFSKTIKWDRDTFTLSGEICPQWKSNGVYNYNNIIEWIVAITQIKFNWMLFAIICNLNYFTFWILLSIDCFCLAPPKKKKNSFAKWFFFSMIISFFPLFSLHDLFLIPFLFYFLPQKALLVEFIDINPTKNKNNE